MSSGFEQYGQWSGQWYVSSAMSVYGRGGAPPLPGCIDHQPARAEAVEEVAHVVAHVRAVEALAERRRDVADRPLAVAQLEHGGGGRVQPHRALGDQEEVLVT